MPTLMAGLVLLLVAVMSTGCGNETKNKVAVKSVSAPAQKPFQPAKGYLPAFYLDRSGFFAVDDSITKYKDKLVLQFRQEKDTTNFGLTVYTIADRDKKLKDVSKAANKARIKYPTPFANALNLSGKKLQFIDQRTREDDYEKLLNEVKKYPIINYVIFEPQIDSSHIRFKITGVEKLPLDLMVNGFATASYYSRSF